MPSATQRQTITRYLSFAKEWSDKKKKKVKKIRNLCRSLFFSILFIRALLKLLSVTNLSPCVYINVEKSINHFCGYTGHTHSQANIHNITYVVPILLSRIVPKKLHSICDNATSKHNMNSIHE